MFAQTAEEYQNQPGVLAKLDNDLKQYPDVFLSELR